MQPLLLRRAPTNARASHERPTNPRTQDCHDLTQLSRSSIL
jgi:hypothetical protein